FPIVGRQIMPKPPLEMFRDHEIVRMLAQGGRDSEITPLGVKYWEYAAEGYRVQRTYQIKTVEGVFEVYITAVGSESKAREYEGGEWHIVAGQSKIETAELSEQAKALEKLREQSKQFVEDWSKKLLEGRLEEAYLDTRLPAERAALEQAFE